MDQGPIFRSLCDVDYYKVTMARVIDAMGHSDVPVRFQFICRTPDIHLKDKIDIAQIQAEIDHVRCLTLTPDELAFLANQPNGLFPSSFLEELTKQFGGDSRHGNNLPDVNIEKYNDELRIETQGLWIPTIWWETIILAIVSELRIRAEAEESGRSLDESYHLGTRILDEKIELLRHYPRVKFMDFGTRRRASRQWHEQVIVHLIETIPNQIIGTSNIDLARRLGLKPMGTQAHEMFQAYSGIYHEPEETLRDSHNRVLRDWYSVYGGPLSFALTDTYGTRFFWKQFTPEQADAWWGLRHDSGDPYAFGEAAIAFYSALGIDSRRKMIVFSDGLDAELMIALSQRFQDAIDTGFGWGTNLTNDIGISPISTAMKLVEANGHGTVKLSDNLAKAVGDTEDIEYFKRVFGYSGGENLVCHS